MWTDTEEGRAFIAEVSKNVVSQVAPEELDLFDDLVQEYFDDPTPPDPEEAASDDALGFGLGGALVAATPAVAAMANVVLGFLLTEVINIAKDQAGGMAVEKLRAHFSTRGESGTGSPPLTTEQLVKVKQLASDQAKAFGMDDDEARKMADALVGSLALSS
jgi:hypothetical protein